MRNVVLTLTMLLIFGAAFAACDDKPTMEQLPIIGSRPNDADLESAIRVKFDSEEQLKGANLNVDVDVEKNEVTLSGTVTSEAERSKAIDLAKSAQAGLTVNDKIDVKPGA